MTQALCLHCGSTKFGALCPCPDCESGSTGDVQLDIAFSDHHMSIATIEGFGRVIKAIRLVCDDDELCFWSFISYISTNHPDILSVDLNSEMNWRSADVLARASPPPVTVEDAGLRRWMREHGSPADADP
jgi:hypothetical protein